MLGIGGVSDSGYANYPNRINVNADGLPDTKGATSEKAIIPGGADEQKSRAQLRADKRAGVEECETCKNRKYQDGSDENVSFKSAAHVSPQAAGAAVRSHEQEHVANAYDKAKQDGGEVVQASVSIHTSICPECGRTYVSGGETTTQIKYKNESNPYQQARKAEDAGKYTGMNVDLVG